MTQKPLFLKGHVLLITNILHNILLELLNVYKSKDC